MSLYGYERQTTPFMDAAQDEFLVAENHFTNASDTGGSVISLLTGKLPTTTKVVYPPDALRGSDSFQHLPGMLQRLGYYNADISMRHYADPYDLNLRNGFAEANFRKLSESGGYLVAKLRNYPRLNPASLLVDRITERARERIRHIWRNRPMQDPLAEVNRPDRRWVHDSDRLAEIRRLVAEAPRPFFLHIHTMGTHGEVFKPTQRVWSREEDYEKRWDVNGYDDAILDFDRLLEETYGLLNDKGLLDSTILVVSSDHGFVHNAVQRLPLLIRLPGAVKSGRLGGNTQRLDIAPTLLDALGIEPRDWMEGTSLLEPAFDGRSRDIFGSGSAGNRAPVGNFWSVVSPQPPWYTLGRLFYVYCDQGFTLWLDRMALTEEVIEGSTMVCEDRLTGDEAKAIMLAHLREKGYHWDD
jgi:arylsulfatase A-like enzyme